MSIMLGIVVMAIILLTSLYYLYKPNEEVISDNFAGENMKLKSVFVNNERIDKKYSCDGEDVNPLLELLDVPVNAKSIALIVDDPDSPSGTWTHWLVFNINPKIKKIEENSVPAGAVHGVNRWGRNDYGGPCPHSGTHRYFFKLYALDKMLELKEGAKKDDVEAAMKGHILAEAKLVGLYGRE